ncbi:MAG: response regulator [Lachnospiraceae bacterium]|nr:response regulator [Lachnospiraceae bacterium]
MDDTKQGRAEVAVISSNDSFLAKSLISKITSNDIDAFLSRGDIKDIEREREKIELVVFFMGEDIENMTETLVYLKDLAGDLDRRIIFIGEQSEYDTAKKTVPEHLILEWFKRPLVMDDLLGCIFNYLENNTGEHAKKTILIVDDDITYMRTVYEWLKDRYHVGMAGSGVQAISYLAKNRADLVLLDYEMPVANGPQVLSMLKNDAQTEEIPVMFLTGHGDRESVLSVVGLSPVDYLLKTIDRTALLQKLDDFFAKRRA